MYRNYKNNSLGLDGIELEEYLQNVGGTPGIKGPRKNWRNRFYGLPDSYDPDAINGAHYAQPSLKVVNKILREATKRAKKEGRK